MRSVVLALETSCDESAAAIVQGRRVLASRVASQAEEHGHYGGVVPELASRRHVEALPLLIEQAFAAAGVGWEEIDAVAATAAPGLVGALLVGVTTAKTLALLHHKTFLGVHHLEGHLCSAQLENPLPPGPFLVLLVSGGHTMLVRVDGPGRYRQLASSVDDAAGEAFDKVARLLGLGYPGGPAIQAVASRGDPQRFSFPRGRLRRPGGGFDPYGFSFSGLKTAVLRQVQALEGEGPLPLADLAASFEAVVVEVLAQRSCRCAADQGLDTLVVVGGVAANLRLRGELDRRCRDQGLRLLVAPLEYCGDNAAMIGVAACERLVAGAASGLELGVSSRLSLEHAELLYGAEAPF
ncbi:MAG: tRNA (adenosine(37)-N6)-threonylcarbamoyltransferase complex transferase subunit TsaD [Aphanocapsa feldmannii 288cV]|nr:MAG: tRNA (adenosine(37)-N6)-threonylcarbamoyltransferase complex transferase subunit TsaD [Aphanocapsa feldmannii 288cV]